MYFVSFPPIIEKLIMNVTFSLGHEPYQKIVINEQEFPINYLKKNNNKNSQHLHSQNRKTKI
jgi:hypothetical protein